MCSRSTVRLCLVVPWALAFLAAPAGAAVNHVVLGYSAGWRDDTYRPADYDFASLTHIARAFLVPHPDGSVGVPDGYFNPDLERLAHAHGVKLLMSAGGEAETADNWVSIATHPAYLDRFLGDLGRLMADHHYDGIDVDWEPAPLTFPEGKAYTSFLKALRGRFPTATITVALPAGEYWVGHHDWADVIANVDYVNAMTYDYAGGWGGVAGHASNLFPPGDYPPQPGYDADNGIRNLIGNHRVPPAKLLMGMTFWGYRFRADHVGGTFPASKPGFADNLSLEQVGDLMGTGHYLSRWDEHAAMPYLERTGGGSVVCYESPASVRRKCEYAAAAGCAGVMVWHLGADVCGRQAPLMDALSQSFGGRAATLPRASLEHQVDALRADGHPPGRPAVVAGMTDDQLESTFADLRHASGVAADQRWHDHVPPTTRP